MTDQLQDVYDMIKQGQLAEARTILEPIIRTDRDNENAWWLYANAATDPSAKRNALNNVLRLSTNESRKSKAQELLNQLDDDPFDFDVSSKEKQNIYTAIDESPNKPRRGGFSCAAITLILVGIVGACAIAFGAIIYFSSNGLIQMVIYPETISNAVPLKDNLQVEEALTEDMWRDLFTYTGNAGDRLYFEIEYDGLASPSIVIFDMDTEIPVLYAEPETTGYLSDTIILEYDGDYLITVSAFKFAGFDMGFGDYSMRVQID